MAISLRYNLAATNGEIAASSLFACGEFADYSSKMEEENDPANAKDRPEK